MGMATERTSSVKGQGVNVLGLVNTVGLCHIFSFVLFLWPLKNVETIFSLQVVQKQATDRIWGFGPQSDLCQAGHREHHKVNQVLITISAEVLSGIVFLE